MGGRAGQGGWSCLVFCPLEGAGGSFGGERAWAAGVLRFLQPFWVGGANLRSPRLKKGLPFSPSLVISLCPLLPLSWMSPGAAPAPQGLLPCQSLPAPLTQPEKLPNHVGRSPASPQAPKVLRLSTSLSHSSLLSGGFYKEVLEQTLLRFLSLMGWDNGFQ